MIYSFGKNNCISVNTDFETAHISIHPGVYDKTLSFYDTYKKELLELVKSHKILNILYSGGVDSETLIECCLKENIPFYSYTFRYIINNELYNKHDIDNVKNIETKYNFKTNYIDIDIEEFFDTLFIEYAIKYKTNSPQLACHLYGLDKIKNNDGIFILAGNAIRINNGNYHDLNDTSLNYSFNDFKYYCYDIYFQQNNIPGIGSFMTYSYDLIMSFLEIQQTHKIFIDIPVSNEQENYRKKVDLYNLGGFNIIPKESKYTGFEYVKKYYSEKHNELNTIRTFDNLYRKPLENIVKIPKIHNVKYKITNDMEYILTNILKENR